MYDPHYPLYHPELEHESCGVGAIVDLSGRATHRTVDQALTIVERLAHRAGSDAQGTTGDGVGILTQIPHRLFVKKMAEQQVELPGERQYGVGMFFFPRGDLAMRQAKSMFEIITRKAGLEVLGWRKVESDPSVIGSRALECMPNIYQVFIGRPREVKEDLAFDRMLYIIRREFEQSNVGTYVPSLSSRTIVYKGMFLVGQLRTFFTDLMDPDYESAIAVVHSRFSTNTLPSWNRAHPNRMIVHNGEINTIKGNADKMLAREETMHTDLFTEEDMTKVLPVISQSGSDSAMLDNTLEFLAMSGMPLPLAALILIPEPWAHNETLSQEERDFYQYYATMMEPWDGPASIVFSDGDVVGAILDRNGLRPSRYCVMDDGRVILSSETGVLELDEKHILKKERLHPGKILLLDTKQQRILYDSDIKAEYAGSKPFGEWLDSHMIHLSELKVPNRRVPYLSPDEQKKLQKAFGYTWENYHDSILTMALTGTEKIGSMGVDTPLAALSERYQPLFYYFKQLFAQVTNPPIDALREEVVTSRTVYVGKNGNLLEEEPENCHVLKIENPILSDLDLLKIEGMKKEGFRTARVSILFYKGTPIQRVMHHLFVEVDKEYRQGANILILSDRGVDENHVAIPSLLAVAAVHKHLVDTKKCTAMSIILESGEPREVHHFAALLGYGASAVNPYLAHAAISQLVEEELLETEKRMEGYQFQNDDSHVDVQAIIKGDSCDIVSMKRYDDGVVAEPLGMAARNFENLPQEIIDKIKKQHQKNDKGSE